MLRRVILFVTSKFYCTEYIRFVLYESGHLQTALVPQKLGEGHTLAIYPPSISLKVVDTVDKRISSQVSVAYYSLRGFIPRVRIMQWQARPYDAQYLVGGWLKLAYR